MRWRERGYKYEIYWKNTSMLERELGINGNCYGS